MTARESRRNLRPGKAARAARRGEVEDTHRRQQALGEVRRQDRAREESAARAPDARILGGRTRWTAPPRFVDRDCLVCATAFSPQYPNAHVCGDDCRRRRRSVALRAARLRGKLGLPPPAPPAGRMMRSPEEAYGEDLRFLADHAGDSRLPVPRTPRSRQEQIFDRIGRIARGIEGLSTSLERVVALLEDPEP